jgi:hypothetical protein
VSACAHRDTVQSVLGDAVQRLSRNRSGLWLWVPAFAGTTTHWKLL